MSKLRRNVAARPFMSNLAAGGDDHRGETDHCGTALPTWPVVSVYRRTSTTTNGGPSASMLTIDSLPSFERPPKRRHAATGTHGS